MKEDNREYQKRLKKIRKGKVHRKKKEVSKKIVVGGARAQETSTGR